MAGMMPSQQPVHVPAFMDDWSEETGVEMDNFPMVEGGDDKNIMQYQMKIPDALDAIAKAGKSLQYVESTQCYHVIDGAAFEREFCMLRITRGKKKDTNQSRPFASMSRTYQMVQVSALSSVPHLKNTSPTIACTVGLLCGCGLQQNRGEKLSWPNDGLMLLASTARIAPRYEAGFHL
eukprot:2924337-Rhodomonas_salina.1